MENLIISDDVLAIIAIIISFISSFFGAGAFKLNGTKKREYDEKVTLLNEKIKSLEDHLERLQQQLISINNNLIKKGIDQ